MMKAKKEPRWTSFCKSNKRVTWWTEGTNSPSAGRRRATRPSAPKVPLETVYRLLDASLLNLGYKISDCVTYRRATKSPAETYEVNLPNLGTEKCIAIISAGCEVTVTFRTGAILGGPKSLCLEAKSFSILEDFDVSSAQSILIDLAPISYTFPSHRDSPNRWMINFLDTPERVIPMSSLCRSVHGFFDGRVKPFTALTPTYQTMPPRPKACR